MNNRAHLRRSHTADMPTLSPIAAVQLQLCLSSVGTLQASEMASTTGRACCYTSGAPVVKLYTRQYCHLVYTRQAQGLQERTSNLHAGVKRSTQPQPCVKPCRGDQCKIPQLPKHADAQAGMCFVVCCAKQKNANQISSAGRSWLPITPALRSNSSKAIAGLLHPGRCQNAIEKARELTDRYRTKHVRCKAACRRHHTHMYKLGTKAESDTCHGRVSCAAVQVSGLITQRPQMHPCEALPLRLVAKQAVARTGKAQSSSAGGPRLALNSKLQAQEQAT